MSHDTAMRWRAVQCTVGEGGSLGLRKSERVEKNTDHDKESTRNGIFEWVGAHYRMIRWRTVRCMGVTATGWWMAPSPVESGGRWEKISRDNDLGEHLMPWVG